MEFGKFCFFIGGIYVGYNFIYEQNGWDRIDGWFIFYLEVGLFFGSCNWQVILKVIYFFLLEKDFYVDFRMLVSLELFFLQFSLGFFCYFDIILWEEFGIKDGSIYVLEE